MNRKIWFVPLLLALCVTCFIANADYQYTFHGLYSENGTYTGGTYTTVYFPNGTSTQFWVNVSTGYALDFDGSDSVNITDSATLNFTETISIEMWLYPRSNPTDSYVIGKRQAWGAGGIPWEIYYYTSGWISFQYWPVGAGAPTSSSMLLENTDQWYHLVWTLNTTSGEYRSYKNAVSTVSLDTWTDPIPTNNINVYLGRRPDAAAHYLNGIVDELRLYNSTLTQTEIIKNYNLGFGRYTPANQADLAAWIHFDEGSGFNASDSSGNGNHAYLASAPATPTWIAGKVDDIYVLVSDVVPDGFEWNVTGVSVPRYFIPTGSAVEHFWLFDLDGAGDDYTFTVYDYAFAFPAWLETLRHVNDTATMIERRSVSQTQNQVPMVMVTGATYFVQVRDKDGTIHDFGIWVPGSNDGTLRLTDISFSRITQLTYRYIQIESTRPSPKTTITTNYADLYNQNQTAVLNCTIRYRNNTIAWTSQTTYPANDQYQFTWNAANNVTDYVVRVTVTHDFYGTMYYEKALEGAYSWNTAPDIGVVGSFSGLTTTNLLPVGLVFIVGMMTSTLSVPIGAFLVVLFMSVFVFIGWITVSTTILTTTMALAIMLGIGWVRRR